jgi:hypothetical protein
MEGLANTMKIELLSNWNGMKESSDNSGAILTAGQEALLEYETAQDWRCWECIALEVWLEEGQVLELTASVYPLKIGRPEYIPVTMAKSVVTGRGWTEVELAFEQFDYLHVTPAFWRLVKKVGITASLREPDGGTKSAVPHAEISIRALRLKALGTIELKAEFMSKAAEPGETVHYDLLVRNVSEERQAVALAVGRYGFESMGARIEPDMLVLEPGQSGMVCVTADVHDGVAPGGYEEHTVCAIPNGNTSYTRKLKLYTIRRLPHPYIIHTEHGWETVRRNVQTYEWASRELARYIHIAESWVVPETQGGGMPYAFELKERFNLHAASVSWKLTGRRDLLDKAVLLLRRFADPATGYPATRAPVFHIYSSHEEMSVSPAAVKVCTGGLIHEGEFMLDVASCYDLLYDDDCWTEEDRRRMELAFRLYIEKVDWMITDGDMNNIPSGGMIGALLCSLVIQDMHWIKRFIEGVNGLDDLVGTGVMDDGWYFEGATNYVVLFADMFTRAIQACEPWGLQLKERKVRPSYQRNAMLSPWSFPREKPFLGMSFQKHGPVRRNYRSVRDVWDAMLPFVDYRGILFGTNDSTDYDMVAKYDLAYYVWRDLKYTSIIRRVDRRDLIYGVGELPEPDKEEANAAESAYADNVGLTVLRSRKEGRSPAEQLQAVVKYGSHGGYHGHFDRTGLVSLMRYGRSAYSPLAAWYSYHPYMFKMWVQTSMAHNMVVVDQRMQEPTESKQLLYYSGSMLQASVVETVARWSDPPYGGQTPYPESFPEERGWLEGRELPAPEHRRDQGDIGDYSEPILQRRLMAVTDDYVIVADYLRGQDIHEYDLLYHFQGFQWIQADSNKHVKHTGLMNESPYGAGQFISDCDWYECSAPALLRFSHEYDRDRDDRDGRHCMYSEDGQMNVHVHSLWPPEQSIMTGWFPEADSVNKRVHFEVMGDGDLLEQGRIGAWIRGKRSIRASVEGVRELTLQASVDKAAKKTLFWGDPRLVLRDGSVVPLSQVPVQYSNVDLGNGIGVDYYGGAVHLEGEPYAMAMPFEPMDRTSPARAVFSLAGLDAVLFEAVIGGDYPLGMDPARRKTVSIRTVGEEACFVTLLEPHEGSSAIVSATAVSESEVTVNLSDGRVQRVELLGLKDDGSKLNIRIREWKEGWLVREEQI